LRVRVNSLAIGLLGLGLRPGDRIGIWAPHCAEWVLTQFAAAKAGLLLVNIDPTCGRGELERILNEVGCKALIVAPGFKANNYFEALRALAPESLFCAPGDLKAGRLPDLKFLIRLGTGSTRGMLRFDDLVALRTPMERQALFALGASLRSTDPISIRVTSDAHGALRAAPLTHRDILSRAFFAGQAIKLSGSERLCIPAPVFDSFAMTVGNLACVTHGATMVYPSEGFDSKAALASIEADRYTTEHELPDMFGNLLGEADLSHPHLA
jgi:fatty-acyl-CoA synthase